MKTYRRHGCTRRHRTYRTLATCMLPTAAWIVGEGPFAVIAWCGTPTVSLHRDESDARQAFDFIDAHGCGGRCTRHHEIVRLERTP